MMWCLTRVMCRTHLHLSEPLTLHPVLLYHTRRTSCFGHRPRFKCMLTANCTQCVSQFLDARCILFH